MADLTDSENDAIMIVKTVIYISYITVEYDIMRL